MNKNYIQQGNYTKISSFRQVVLPLDYGFQIGPKEPVRLLDAVLEELDYTRLQQLYSSKGRKSLVPPQLLFKVYVLAMTEGIVSVRKWLSNAPRISITCISYKGTQRRHIWYSIASLSV